MAGHKTLLFVDDEPDFLAGITELFTDMSKGAWEITTAPNHARALEFLSQLRADVVVLDIGMPDMDGVQFLHVLRRAHPSQQIVMLTGRATPELHKECLQNGASLFLEKPTSSEGFKAVFAALDALANAQPQSGFRGVMRRVGLADVLQMECLSRKSSILEIFTPKMRGRIVISEGAIVHADSGALQGEVALYGLLALRDGEFNFLPFAEPPRRTIAGHWESLLMEAARLNDEGTDLLKAENIEVTPPAPETIEPPSTAHASPVPPGCVGIQEILLCSGANEQLYDSNCEQPDRRLRLLQQIEEQATQLNGLMHLGRLDRLEILSSDSRAICQVLPDRRLFIRAARPKPAP